MSPMDPALGVSESYLNTQSVAVLLCVSLVTWLVVRLLSRGPSEDAITFSVPIPEQCRLGWTGEQLSEPSIKV